MTTPPVGAGWAARLDEREWQELVGLGARRSLDRGSALFVQGERPGQVAVVLRGRAKVLRVTAEGGEILLAVREPGELVGELAALDGGPRSATVTALEPLEVLVVEAGRFRSWLLAHPARALDLLAAVVRRLRESDASRSDFTSTDAAGRLCRKLLELAARHGVPEQHGVRIDLPVTQEELAGWVGASRESVARCLRRLREDGAIATARRRVTILDLDRVRRLAD